MIGIYCRISKQKEHGRDVSIDVQKKHGIKFAKSMGMEFRVFVDEGISGANENISERPEFALLLNAIKNEEINTVYCYDQSRIERNNRIWNMFLSLMLDKKCKYYPSGNFLDLDVPENQFFTGVMSLANELYAALTGIKVKEAIYENAKKGKTHGLTAYGYTKGENGYFKINEEEAIVVKRIFQMSLNGIGTYTIAKILNNEGVPTRFSQLKGTIKRKDKFTKQITIYEKSNVKWRGNVIHDIIKNPIYKGTRMWNNEKVPVPMMLDEELWQQVNDNLEGNKTKVGKKEEYNYLLNGIIFCGHCDSEYRGKKRLKGRDNAYKCKGKTQHHVDCCSRGINISKLETFIIHHLFNSKDFEIFLENLPKRTAEADNLKAKLVREKKELDKLLGVEKLAYKHLLDPDFEDDETIKTELKATKKRIKEKMQTIELLENKIINSDSDNRVKRIKNIIEQYYFDSGFKETRQLVHSIIKKITIRHEYKSESKGGIFLVKIEYKGFEEIMMFSTDWQALKWHEIGHYRSRAIKKEDLNDDMELYRYLLKSTGNTDVIPADFYGFETYSGITSSIIELKNNELILFD